MEEIAEQIDTLDNLAHALLLPLPASMHVEQLRLALPDVVAKLKAAYHSASGANPWE